ncbi:hypothetical protein JMJ56_32800 [Belnapia sp. T18]|uniref:Transposase n=1 Tax=Belnapia arida TaxID=2804533 RepID=A0ABS1UDK3_9PROT|nr:hypothetical protein [Belnapia arida]MBL6082739.1 hypothetical protein [Belnapia arida]
MSDDVTRELAELRHLVAALQVRLDAKDGEIAVLRHLLKTTEGKPRARQSCGRRIRREWPDIGLGSAVQGIHTRSKLGE